MELSVNKCDNFYPTALIFNINIKIFDTIQFDINVDINIKIISRRYRGVDKNIEQYRKILKIMSIYDQYFSIKIPKNLERFEKCLFLINIF